MNQPDVQNPSSQQTFLQLHTPPRQPPWIAIPLVICIAAASAFSGYYVANSRISLSTKLACTKEAKLCPDGSSVGRTGPQCEFASCPTTLKSPTNSISPQVTEWKTTRSGGFLYEYPYGWNVAELWQDDYQQNGVMIAIDPNPINTSPRGGPIATFQITILNGKKNPNEILTDQMNSFNSTNYFDITKKTIDAPIGKIYHYKGKIAGEMLYGESVEKYYFTFNQNPQDPLNQQVVTASLDLKDDQQLSAMLQHIVLSFKELTQ